MIIKQTRYPDRRPPRRHSRVPRILALLFVDALGLFILYQVLYNPQTVVVLSTPTPAPTPTRSAVSYVAEATDAYYGGAMATALSAYRQALDLDPAQPELYVAMGRILVYRGSPERALQLARHALLYDPEYAPAWALLCVAYDWLSLPQEAIPLCERAITLDPTLPEAYAYLAEAHIDAGNWFVANDTIDTALRLDENNVEVLRNYAYVLEVQGNYTAAIEYYRQALQRQPFQAHLYISIGRNQHVLGFFNQAQESYQSAVEVDPENLQALDRAGMLYLLQGDYGPAQALFQQALELDPTYSRILGRLGSLYFQRRNYEDAIPALENAVRYGAMEARRRTVLFTITEEAQDATSGINAATGPTGRTVMQGDFVFPEDPRAPLRTLLTGAVGLEDAQGTLRLDPLDGRYILTLSGLPQPAAGRVYVGWFRPLLTPEGNTINTGPLRVESDGTLTLNAATGPVKGAAIESYYTLALCYYYLGRCADARPYIAEALRIAPGDPTVLQTQQLCAGQ